MLHTRIHRVLGACSDPLKVKMASSFMAGRVFEIVEVSLLDIGGNLALDTLGCQSQEHHCLFKNYEQKLRQYSTLGGQSQSTHYLFQFS